MFKAENSLTSVFFLLIDICFHWLLCFSLTRLAFPWRHTVKFKTSISISFSSKNAFEDLVQMADNARAEMAGDFEYFDRRPKWSRDCIFKNACLIIKLFQLFFFPFFTGNSLQKIVLSRFCSNLAQLIVISRTLKSCNKEIGSQCFRFVVCAINSKSFF